MAKDKRLWLLASQIVQSTAIVAALKIQATLAKVDTSHAVTTLDTIAASEGTLAVQALHSCNVKSKTISVIVQCINPHHSSPHACGYVYSYPCPLQEQPLVCDTYLAAILLQTG
tara:strand:+ start:1023 stop:1364 length:342 start_codon:yes stop_codon:yes gene_type:complete